MTVMWSANPAYGLYKSGNLICVGGAASIYLWGGIRRIGMQKALRLIIVVLAGLLLLALLYKLRYGFWDRDVLFFRNGAVVFGRLMGVGALLAVYCFRGSARYATVALFALATIWTASRGPILALFVVSIVLILLQSRSVGRAAVGTAVVSCFAFWLVANSELLADVGLLRLSETITAAREGSILALRSVGVRFDVNQQTIALILRKPLGVGVGGWSHYVPGGLLYPHNLFLELWSEGGVVLGSFALVPLLLFLIYLRSSVLAGVALFFLVAQQTSGDLLDARYLVVFSAMAWMTSRHALEGSGEPSHS